MKNRNLYISDSSHSLRIDKLYMVKKNEQVKLPARPFVFITYSQWIVKSYYSAGEDGNGLISISGFVVSLLTFVIITVVTASIVTPINGTSLSTNVISILNDPSSCFELTQKSWTSHIRRLYGKKIQL